MKKFILIFVLLFSFTYTFGQSGKIVINLKTGNSLIGNVVESRSGDYIVVRVHNNELRHVRWDEIDSWYQYYTPKQKDPGQYRGVVDVSYNYNAYGILCDRFMISTTHGYQFNPYIALGVGVGFEINDLGWSNVISVPMFINVHSSFIEDTTVSPFVSVNLGYDLGLTVAFFDDAYFEDGEYYDVFASGDGWYIEPTIGAEFRLGYKSAIFVGFSLVYRHGIDKISHADRMVGVGAKVGVSF